MYYMSFDLRVLRVNPAILLSNTPFKNHFEFECYELRNITSFRSRYRDFFFYIIVLSEIK